MSSTFIECAFPSLRIARVDNVPQDAAITWRIDPPVSGVSIIGKGAHALVFIDQEPPDGTVVRAIPKIKVGQQETDGPPAVVTFNKPKAHWYNPATNAFDLENVVGLVEPIYHFVTVTSLGQMIPVNQYGGYTDIYFLYNASMTSTDSFINVEFWSRSPLAQNYHYMVDCFPRRDVIVLAGRYSMYDGEEYFVKGFKINRRGPSSAILHVFCAVERSYGDDIYNTYLKIYYSLI